jgi:cell wall-associated NlpC family hydrolase
MRAIGPLLTAEESAAFIAALRTQVKRRTRFRHQGRNPTIGLDCAGLPLWAMQAIGRPVTDIVGYGREPYRDGLEGALIANLGARVPKESMRAGDVVMMRFAGDPRHVGILTDYPDGGLALIHTHDTLKMVREHRLDQKRRDSIVAVWRP